MDEQARERRERERARSRRYMRLTHGTLCTCLTAEDKAAFRRLCWLYNTTAYAVLRALALAAIDGQIRLELLRGPDGSRAIK